MLLNFNKENLSMSKILKLAVPAGIGDTLWVMTKVQSLLKRYMLDKVSITVCNDSLQRAGNFLRSFNFVYDVKYSELGIMEKPITFPNGCYNITPSQPNWHDAFHWFLQANSHLEHGNRLEEWFPELEINWRVMDCFNWERKEIEFADKFKESFGEYCVFYLGPEAGNTICGHNRGPLWTPSNWFELSELALKNNLKIVFVGATYDQSYWNSHFEEKMLFNTSVYNAIGKWPIQRTLAIVKNAKFIIGHQSGIPITAAFMDVPGGAFWRPHGDSISPDHYITFSEDMASAWVPPDMLESKKWLPLIYTKCSPSSIFEHAKEYWL